MVNVKEVKGVIFNNKLFLLVLAILIFSISVLAGGICDISNSSSRCCSLPATCEGLGLECGVWDDCCGGQLDCGICTNGVCDARGQCVCLPKTCADYGNSCGYFSDSCGGWVVCGCPEGLTCLNTQCGTNTCTPNCGNQQCGSDGCGGSCGSCPHDYTCVNYQCTNNCGNNKIDHGEQCELPSTNNNNYCTQSTTNCLGNKLGTRDAFGNCNSVCGCINDPFIYQCVKGVCGAQCSVNSDCNDNNPNTQDECLNDCTCKYTITSFCGDSIINNNEECEFDNQCGTNCCQLTFNDYCDNKKLVEFNTNKILDDTTVSNTCQNSCNDCECDNCQPQCNQPPTHEYCVKGVCGAQCDKNSDCDDNNPNTQDTCLSNCMCQHTPIISCGNGIVEPGEQCEFNNQCVDQNPLTTDKCEDCQCEHEFICNDSICVRDGIWANSTSGNEFYCAGDRTYYQCKQDGCGYEHINQCESTHCSASPFCNTKQPNSDLATCNIFGQTYLQDRCNSDCQLMDDNCESRFTGCTADPLCNDIIPGTGNCNLQCQTKICVDGQTQQCGQGSCTGVRTCYNDSFGECSTKNLDCGTCCKCDANGNETFAVQNDCSQYNLQALDICTFNPDSNPFTLDTASGFSSQCVDIFTCSYGNYTNINHECDIENCNAQCENNADCAKTDCDNLDKCYDGIFRDYIDVNNTCSNCSCLNGICNVFVEKNTDFDQDTYNIECENDCDDNNSAIHPGALEVCNKKDDNCNGQIDEGFPGIKKKITFHAKNQGKVVQLGNQTVFSYSKLYFDGWATKGLIFDGGKTSLELVSNDGKRTTFYLTSTTKKILENTCSTFKVQTYGTGTYWSKETGRLRIPITSVYTINRLTNKVDIYGEANGFKYNITNVDVKCILSK